jgi:hypothetical protein
MTLLLGVMILTRLEREGWSIQEHFPKGKVFEALYKVPELKDKCIVPSVYKCRAYALYLSERGASIPIV